MNTPTKQRKKKDLSPSEEKVASSVASNFGKIFSKSTSDNKLSYNLIVSELTNQQKVKDFLKIRKKYYQKKQMMGYPDAIAKALIGSPMTQHQMLLKEINHLMICPAIPSTSDTTGKVQSYHSQEGHRSYTKSNSPANYSMQFARDCLLKKKNSEVAAIFSLNNKLEIYCIRYLLDAQTPSTHKLLCYLILSKMPSSNRLHGSLYHYIQKRMNENNPFHLLYHLDSLSVYSPAGPASPSKLLLRTSKSYSKDSLDGLSEDELTKPSKLQKLSQSDHKQYVSLCFFLSQLLVHPSLVPHLESIGHFYLDIQEQLSTALERVDTTREHVRILCNLLPHFLPDDLPIELIGKTDPTVKKMLSRLLSTKGTIAKELDGTPCRLSNFTMLHALPSYSPEQLLYQMVFSVQVQFLKSFRSSNPSNDDTIDVLFSQACSMLQQAQRYFTISSLSLPVDYIEMVIIETIHILNQCCLCQRWRVAKVYPLLKQFFQTLVDHFSGQHVDSPYLTKHLPMSHPGLLFIACLSFLLEHIQSSVYAIDEFLNTFLKPNVFEALFVYDTLFLSAFFKLLLKYELVLVHHTRLFQSDYPKIFYAFAVAPFQSFNEFCMLLPSIISSENAIDVYVRLLDFPILCACLDALPHLQSFKSKERDSILSILVGSLNPHYAQFRLSITTIPFHIHDSRRAIAALNFSNVLFDIFFSVLLPLLSEEDANSLLERILSLFSSIWPSSFDHYKSDLIECILFHVRLLFLRFPSLVVSQQSSLISHMQSPRSHSIFLHLISLTSRILSSTDDVVITTDITLDYQETFEGILFERGSELKVAMQLHSENPSQYPPVSDLDIQIISILITALCRTVGRTPDSVGRAVICLSSLIKSPQFVPPILFQKVGMMIRLLNYPSVASTVLCSPLSKDCLPLNFPAVHQS